MKIEEVEALESEFANAVDANSKTGFWNVSKQALSALRAEAWHPIEKAAELGAKDGREVLLHNQADGVTWFASWDKKDNDWYSEYPVSNPTHFRFINPPEGA